MQDVCMIRALLIQNLFYLSTSDQGSETAKKGKVVLEIFLAQTVVTMVSWR